MTTILLLLLSNVFMTFAWYGHLKYGNDWPLWQVIAVSWGIAFFEYCLAVPANRLGYGEFTGFQLKIIQEVATLAIFVVFAVLVLKEKFAWNYDVLAALHILLLHLNRPQPEAKLHNLHFRQPKNSGKGQAVTTAWPHSPLSRFRWLQIHPRHDN
jgi:uncharacterized protein (DUF486 family)